ncbi:MAG: hypothetical protein K6G25_13690 [Bacteroidales bacterium]|nr:hypothetical protein [Bacteroidales bacterium]
MKKAFMTLTIILFAVAAQAQIKVHDDNWVSIGCLNGDFGLQVTPIGYTYYRTQDSADYSWAVLSMANIDTQKHWIVQNIYKPEYKNDFTFYVSGNGNVHSKATYITAIQENNRDREPINSREALNNILGINGFYYETDSQVTPESIEGSEYVCEEAVSGMIADLEKKSIGLSGENLAEVLPDAVRMDTEARLCIDYNAVVTMLVEAVKQQQAEINSLRQVLEENGLMEPERK